VGILDWLIEQVQWLIGLADPQNLRGLVNLGGPWWVSYAVLTGIIFSETGLLIGFFLPGDSLLFAAGFLASQNVFNYWLLNLCLCAAAILGDAVNYYFGRKTSEKVFDRGHFRFVKREHLLAAKEFYDRHGAMAIILARFAPFVRTFTPYVAGVARMNYRQFAIYNITGGIAWVFSMTTAGYWLGQIPWVEHNFEKVVLTIVFLSVLPIGIGVGRTWLEKRRERRGLARVAETSEV
jgi:membrane-associated protein